MEQETRFRIVETAFPSSAINKIHDEEDPS